MYDGGAEVAITPMVQDSIIVGVSGASTMFWRSF